MDFKDQIRQLSARIPKIKGSIQTEEATKNALILPFIQALGYDVFDPTEVVPELDCDLVKKKGEKIDYAIRRDGETVMLVECKHCGQNLSLHETQLQRYFVASKAKFGVLTNGVEYRFYTDLVKPNIMDDAPFLSVDMENLRDGQIEELKKFHKSYFDLDTIISTASELKYMSELKAVIREEFLSPSEDLVRMFARRVYDGAVTQKVLGQFTGFVKKSMAGYINDVIADRLDLASSMADSGGAADVSQADPLPDTAQDGGAGPEPSVVTTDEELEGFYIVKSILHGVVAPAPQNWLVASVLCCEAPVLGTDSFRRVLFFCLFQGVVQASRYSTAVRMNPSNDLTTSYLYPALVTSAWNSFCAVLCVPFSVFISMKRPWYPPLGTAMKRSAAPATTPSAFSRAPVTALRAPPLGMAKRRVAN